MSRVSDAQLQMYIDQVFGRFDRDNSGSLDSNELANFFNDLFTKMNHPKRVTYAEAQSAIQEIDIDRNGVVNKSQLLIAFKRLLTENQKQKNGYGSVQQNSGWGQSQSVPVQQSGWNQQSQQQSSWNQNQQGQQGWNQQTTQQTGWNQSVTQGGWNQNQPVNQQGWQQQSVGWSQPQQSGWGQGQQSGWVQGQQSGWVQGQQSGWVQGQQSGWGGQGQSQQGQNQGRQKSTQGNWGYQGNNGW